jgi:hypothetical protein
MDVYTTLGVYRQGCSSISYTRTIVPSNLLLRTKHFLAKDNSVSTYNVQFRYSAQATHHLTPPMHPLYTHTFP